MGLPNFSHGVAKYINVFGEEAAFSICEIDGEKIGGSGYVRSAVSHRGHLMQCWADKALAQPTRYALLASYVPPPSLGEQPEVTDDVAGEA